MQLLIFGLGLALLWFWWSSSGTRELATKAARSTCQKTGLQFLDDTVEMKKIRLQRNEQGHISLARLYSFEFSATGSHRNFGYIVTLGNKIYTIELENPDTEESHRTLH